MQPPSEFSCDEFILALSVAFSKKGPHGAGQLNPGPGLARSLHGYPKMDMKASNREMNFGAVNV